MKKIVLSIVTLLISECWAQIEFGNCVVPPLKCPNPNITFWLFTRSTQDDPYQILMDDPESMQNAKFTPNVPTIIIIHGYTGYRDFDPNPQIRPAYFQLGEYNIISLDYHPLAEEPCYPTAALNVPLIGRCTAEFLDQLVFEKGIPLRDIHVIGFSLGAQVSGAIANWIRSGQLERITGLDPAMPLFVTLDTKKKLDKSDAKFVDVIHTNALDKGKLEPSGHVDFYANGGMKQPGCENTNKAAESSCNHVRAPEYYGESINSPVGFYGLRCSSWFLYSIGLCQFNEDTEEAIMGMYTPNTTRGLFFVDTNSSPPYAKGPRTTKEKHNEETNGAMEDQTVNDMEKNVENVDSRSHEGKA